MLTPPLTRDHAQVSEVVNIEATGLGGKDLGVVGPWDISIRTDPEGQNVYGPSRSQSNFGCKWPLRGKELSLTEPIVAFLVR